MRILLVHQNFPGQFRHLAPALADRGHEVVALTAQSNAQATATRTARYAWDKAQDGRKGGLGTTYQLAAERGLAAARAAQTLRDKHGFIPDVIFGHSGWGETLFLREVWPGARLLVYAEFMYATRGLDADFDPDMQATGLGARISTSARRAHLTQALVDADAGLAPTAWQASTFPPELAGKLTVIHDGVDCARVAPNAVAQFAVPEAGLTLRPGDEVLSYVGRSLEPYRGIHIFLRALPAVLAARPQARVVIVGQEGQSYGQPPKDAASWKAGLLAELEGQIDFRRVHFVGRVPYDHYLSLLQVTRAHAYLTYPFVLGWSMIEAMAAGALVVGSRTPPVTEVIEDGRNGRLVDFFDIPGWSAALTAALADPAAAEPMRAMARATALARYDLATVSLPRLLAFVEGRPLP